MLVCCCKCQGNICREPGAVTEWKSCCEVYHAVVPLAACLIASTVVWTVTWAVTLIVGIAVHCL